jgi:hypothetical protein
MEDLEESIRRAQQTANITPQDHPDLADWLNSFERLLYLSSHPGYHDEALKSFSKHWNCLNGIPFHLLASALGAIQLLKQRNN